MTFSIMADCYAEYHYAKCRKIGLYMSVIIPNVVVLIVVAPKNLLIL